MSNFRRQVLVNGFRATDLGVMAAAFAAAFVLSAQVSPQGFDEFLSTRVKLANILFFVGFAAAWHLIFLSYGLYRSRRLGRTSSEWWDIAKAVVSGTLLLAALATLFGLSAVGRAFTISFFAIALLGTVAVRGTVRLFLSEARRKGKNLHNLIIVGCGSRGEAHGREIRHRPELGYLLLGYVDDISPPTNPLNGEPETLLGSLDELEQVLEAHRVDEVFVALPTRSHYETIASAIALGEELGLIVRTPAEPFKLRFAKASIDYLDDAAILTFTTPRPTPVSLGIKRAIDIVVSACALIALAPAFAVLAAAIKLDSEGPVFFGQTRVALGCRRFKLFKFRTMAAGAEDHLKEIEQLNEASGAGFKIKDDPRLTRLGPFLRKYSIDEFPQFYNVLKGDLSLVGPRPMSLRDAELLDAPWLTRRFSVKPGLTCLWQANGRHQISFEHWMELDLQYIDNWSFKLDFEIMLKTIPAVLRGTGT